jgi:hypothetical protein
LLLQASLAKRGETSPAMRNATGASVTTQQLLDEAIVARHALLTGKAKVSCGMGDRRIEYSVAKLAELDAYIAQLRRSLSARPAVRNRIRYMVPD